MPERFWREHTDPISLEPRQGREWARLVKAGEHKASQAAAERQREANAARLATAKEEVCLSPANDRSSQEPHPCNGPVWQVVAGPTPSLAYVCLCHQVAAQYAAIYGAPRRELVSAAPLPPPEPPSTSCRSATSRTMATSGVSHTQAQLVA